MNKRQRTTGPDQWSYVSKAWNASTLAEQVTKLTGENEELSDTLQTCSQHIEYYKQNYEQANEKYEQYKVGYQQKNARVEELTAELDKAVQVEAAAAIAHADNIAQLNATATVKQEEIVAKMSAESEQNSVVAAETQTKLNAEITELQRALAEQRGRTKTWRVRYEKLVSEGAKALANKTVSEYGVTPDEVTLYKNFAQKQAAASIAAKLAQEAALEATNVGLKSLTNA